jgi:predicted RNase H-like nuclease (RuvC/YqgF family)
VQQLEGRVSELTGEVKKTVEERDKLKSEVAEVSAEIQVMLHYNVCKYPSARNLSLRMKQSKDAKNNEALQQLGEEKTQREELFRRLEELQLKIKDLESREGSNQGLKIILGPHSPGMSFSCLDTSCGFSVKPGIL